MDLERAAEIASEFLDAFIDSKHCFMSKEEEAEAEADELRFVLHEVQPEDEGLLVQFNLGPGLTEDDEEPREYADECLAALRKDHPEIADVEITVSFFEMG